MSYQLTNDPDTVIRLFDKATVPRFHRFWFEYEEWLGAGGIPIPVTEINVNVAERVWRDLEIESIKWLRERHRDEVDLGLAATLTAGRFAELLCYMQALRDWPQSQAFPSADKRPGAPLWIAEQAQ